jgi:outer membrane protein insertion porin family
MKLFLMMFLLLTTTLYASPFLLKEVSVECQGADSCQARRQRFLSLAGEYRSLVHLKETIRIFASDGGYQSFTFNVFQSENFYKLLIQMKLKPIIQEINIGTVDRNLNMDPALLLSVKEGDYFETQKLKQDLNLIQKRLESIGYPQNSFDLKVKEKNEKVFIDLSLTLGKPRVFKRIKTNSSSSFVNEFLTRKFLNFYNKPFEFTRFKIYLDEAQKELINYGYYLIGLDFTPLFKKNRVILDINVTQDQLFALDVKNLKNEKLEEVHGILKELFKKYKRPVADSIMKSAIEDHYKRKAMLNVSSTIETEHFRNRYKEPITLYRVVIKENDKTKLTNINFIGQSFFTKSDLKSMFQDEAFELARAHYYDEDYLNYFVGFLKTKYIEKGFVQAKIIGPVKVFDSDKKEATVEYIIQEGQRAFVRSLSFEGVPPDLEDNMMLKITNKVGSVFNPIAMAEDLKIVTNIMQEKGYYFAEISNANDDSLISYSKSGSDVDVRYIINPGNLHQLNRIIFLGNNKTRKHVLLNKILLEKGDIISPAKTREFEANISATGLFNSVSITPVRHTSKTNTATDLVVKVVERDYGLVEFAPGFRTDLGIKLTATASYVNIGGMNRAISLRSQINQRINYQTFDPRRRKERRQLVEHNETLTYTQGDIFDTQISSSTGLSYQRKRFYSFDAEIFRINNTLTRDLSKRLSTSLRYQYEAITQTDATELRDNGSFKIGAITPSLTYDLRNSQVNPLKGAFFNMSCEFANPYLLSQKENDLTINYYKLVSRNRFYVPHKYGTVAISMVAGVQENLAKDKVSINGVDQTIGYIPNIKVFRLTGMDIVRGFNDEEINRVSGDSRDDISAVKVQERAYLANFKFEPRYIINDALIAGVFYDAGRVFVNQVNMSQLRDSVGVTFKILTPVGTLDFDYGIKLLRERNKDGSLEDPGRFHVSIGFF